ncbi:MAG: hypothetical protein ACFFC7_35320 [Candidatus Hermodarchaeota archaeon]
MSVHPVYIPLKTDTSLETLSVDKLFNMYTPNLVRGPEFEVSEAFLVHKKSVKEADYQVDSRIMTLIQNIGDATGYLRLNTIKLLVETENGLLEGNYYRSAKVRDSLLNQEPVQERPVEIILKMGEEEINFQKKAFDFILPKAANIKWLNAKLLLKGEHTTPKGQMRMYNKKIPINLNPKNEEGP